MSEKLEWIIQRPWVVHILSFILMVIVASPAYRLPAGSSLGIGRVVIDHVGTAIRDPGLGLIVFLRLSLDGGFIFILVWILVLLPLFFAHRRTGFVLSYVSLIPLWFLFILGLSFRFSH